MFNQMKEAAGSPSTRLHKKRKLISEQINDTIAEIKGLREINGNPRRIKAAEDTLDDLYDQRDSLNKSIKAAVTLDLTEE
jgi:flagellar hook-associated protein FlgK